MMDLTLFKEVKATTNKIALSTVLDNQADVKIVNFVWDETQPDTLFFSSVKTSEAIASYDQHPDVALITIPNDGTPGNPFLRARHVQIKRSTKTMTELLPLYLKTVPHYQQVWDAIGPTLVVFELKLGDVKVDPGLGRSKEILQFQA